MSHPQVSPAVRADEEPDEEHDESEPGEEDLPAQPEPQVGEHPLPLPLVRLHKRLNKDLELYKLHVKHYHMSLNQFKKRTSELALPDRSTRGL